jgi:hypothetical protein
MDTLSIMIFQHTSTNMKTKTGNYMIAMPIYILTKNEISSILQHCIIYTPLYSACRWILKAEKCCCELFKMIID